MLYLVWLYSQAFTHTDFKDEENWTVESTILV